MDITALVGVAAVAQSNFGTATAVESYYLYGAITVFWFCYGWPFEIYRKIIFPAGKREVLTLIFLVGVAYVYACINAGALFVALAVPDLRTTVLCSILLQMYVIFILLLRGLDKKSISDFFLTFTRPFDAFDV